MLLTNNEISDIYEQPSKTPREFARSIEQAVIAKLREQKPVALPFAILDEELQDLHRFHECVSDGEGYDVPKERMRRLAEIGLLRRVTANIYEHTTFGLSVINGDFTHPAPSANIEIQQFLTDVVTAAGLLRYGKTDKALATRISDAAYKIRIEAPSAQEGFKQIADLAFNTLNKPQTTKRLLRRFEADYEYCTSGSKERVMNIEQCIERSKQIPRTQHEQGYIDAICWLLQELEKRPVVVEQNADATDMNELHGEAYGVDWVYPPMAAARSGE